MTLSEFIDNVKIKRYAGEWEVVIPLKTGPKGRVFVKEDVTEFEALEIAYHYLIEEINRNKKT